MRRYLPLVMLLGCANPKFPEPAPTIQTARAGSGLACSVKFQRSNHCAALFWEREQTEEEPGVFTFKIFRSNLLDGSPLVEDLGALTVDLWMPDMNHGSSPITLSRIDTGTFRASGVWFSMPGRWQIRFSSESEPKNEAILEITR